MKKVIKLVVDNSIAKEIFEEYYEYADFVSIETEDEAKVRERGFDTWDNLELDADDFEEVEVCEDCGNIECDCDVKI